MTVRLKNRALLDHAEVHEDRFLALRQDFLELLLRRRDRLAGLGAGFAHGLELGGDFLGAGALVLERGAEVARGLLRGREGLVLAVAAASAAAAEHAEPAAAVATREHELL